MLLVGVAFAQHTSAGSAADWLAAASNEWRSADVIDVLLMRCLQNAAAATLLLLTAGMWLIATAWPLPAMYTETIGWWTMVHDKLDDLHGTVKYRSASSLLNVECTQ